MDYYDGYAAYLHMTCPVVDAHLDLVTEVYRNYLAGKCGILKNKYLVKLREGGVNLVFASLFMGERELRGCFLGHPFSQGAIMKKALEMLAVFLKEMEEAGKEAVLIKNRDSLLEVAGQKKENKKWPVGIVLYLEGLDMLEGEPELLRCFYEMGVRGAALTWNQRRMLPNPFAEGCRTQEEEAAAQAISEKGIRVISLMEELGIFVDGSHLSRRAGEILPLVTKKPYVATHSNADSLAPHPRNLTDRQITRLAKRGGVIGVNAYRDFVSEKEISPLEGFCNQIVYLLEKAGENHTGLGLDFGEGSCLAGYRELPEITARMLRRGYPERVVRKILGENWLRFLYSLWNQ